MSIYRKTIWFTLPEIIHGVLVGSLGSIAEIIKEFLDVFKDELRAYNGVPKSLQLDPTVMSICIIQRTSYFSRCT